jgi:signal transduction histidine kinase
MIHTFQDLIDRQNLLKARLLLFAGGISSFVFYFLMKEISTSHQDWLLGRYLIVVASIIGLTVSFIKSIPFQWIRWSLNSVIVLYFAVYLKILTLNDWSLFHRWSYFILLSILAVTTLSWFDAVVLFFFSFISPVVLGFFSPLTNLELIHFHSVNFVTLFVLGVAVRSHYQYRDQVIQLTKSLVQSTKMSALGEMSAGVAHEINNPLMILISNVNMIEKHIHSNDPSLVQPGRLEPFILRSIAAANRISVIVSGLLNFSRSENKEPKTPQNVTSILAESLDLFQEKLKSLEIELVYEPPTGELLCQCRRYEIMQIFVNLMNNAIDACLESEGAKQIELLLFKDHNLNMIEFTIIDSGNGISPQTESKIMEPFYTTKKIGKGTGLGLSISLGLAKSHGGDLFLNREFDRTCFTLRLPHYS